MFVTGRGKITKCSHKYVSCFFERHMALCAAPFYYSCSALLLKLAATDLESAMCSLSLEKSCLGRGGMQPACPQPGPGLSSPRFERQPGCVGCASLCGRDGSPCPPLDFPWSRPGSIAADLFLESHFSTTMLKLAAQLFAQHHSHVPKVDLLRRVRRMYVRSVLHSIQCVYISNLPT
jgi:hypothetical protein